jgi:muramoyltetrapeptide carboxypeptidase
MLRPKALREGDLVAVVATSSVREVVGDRDIPVLGDVDIDHAGPNLPTPLGVRAEMDADALTLSLLEPVVTLSGE